MSFFKMDYLIVDEQKINEFWKWFQGYELYLIEQIESHSGTSFVFEVDSKLLPLFPNFKGELEFEFGFNGVKWDFNFFYCGKRYLLATAKEIRKRMPDSLRQKWVFNIEK